MAIDPSNCCEKIVQKIKESNLHFLLKENPFSVQITIRKKFVDERNLTPKGCEIIDALEDEIKLLKNSLKTKSDELENSVVENHDLRLDLEKQVRSFLRPK